MMNVSTITDDSQYLDPVFLSMGMEVYSNEFAQMKRQEVLEAKMKGKRIWSIIPQEGFQEEVLTNEADIKIIGGSRGSGKAVSVDSMVVTPFGYRRMGDLKVGDIVSDPVTGGMERVIQIFEHPQKDLYEVTFDDGTTCECCDDHLWKVRETGHAMKRRSLYGGSVEDDYRIWSFRQIREWMDRRENGAYRSAGKKGKTQHHLVIPVCQPVRFTKSGNSMRKPDIDPYVIGALLGDGHFGEDGICLFTPDKEVVDQFVAAGLDMGHVYTKPGDICSRYRIPNAQIRPVLDTLRIGTPRGLDKFVPTAYKWGTVDERWAVLQGLMDTDGTVDADNGSAAVFTSVSRQLAEDVQFIARSLGGTAGITTKQPFYRDEDGNKVDCQLAYNVRIKMPDCSKMFRLSKKKDRCKPFNGGVSEVARRIVSYRYIGKKDARCITVDSPNALYMLQDFIVTHNTAISLIGAFAYADNPDVNMYGFRRLEADVKRGIYKSAKPIFRGFANFADTSFEIKFFNGNGATMKMEHLQDLSKIKDRFRGAEMPYIVIEELAEFTKENLNVIFDLIGSNRSTAGVPSQFICTCNPVGKSNKLRLFLDWWIDPETDLAIPERSGKIRYFCRYGEDVMEIAWGDTPEEVYENPNARAKICSLSDNPDEEYRDYITSVTFIDGAYSQNKILQVSDPKYMNRISSGGSKSTINDIRGIWRDVDDSDCLLSLSDMQHFFGNTAQPSGRKTAAGDIALVNDFIVLVAADGNHITDVDALSGISSDNVLPFIDAFLRRNGVAKEDFTFDTNGIGTWIRQSSMFAKSKPFDNRAPAENRIEYRTLKSECQGRLVDMIQRGLLSIEPALLKKKFRKGKEEMSLEDILLVERLCLKWKTEDNPKEMLRKVDMKAIVGHSPDFIETLIYLMSVLGQKKGGIIRRGFGLL